MFRTTRVFFLAGWLAVAVGWTAEPPRVAVMVSAPAQAADWQAALTAELSRRSDLQVVERADLKRLLGERLAAGKAAPAPPVEGVQVFLHFQQVDSGKWLVEKVDAASGVVMDSAAWEGRTMEDAPEMAGVAGNLLAKKNPPAAEAGPRVVVVESGKQDSRSFLLAARLRDALRSENFRVLDRALTQEVVTEKADSERGWREGAPAGAFFGADTFVELTPHEAEGELRVIRARDGKLVGTRRFTFDGPGVTNEIFSWLLPLLGHSAAETSPYLPTVEIEALEPFYRGLALYDAGRFAEATAEFARAFLRNDKFRDALLWEARCYDALDLAPLAASVRRFAEIGLVGNGSSGSARTSPSEAVAFLGVEGDSALSAIAASALCRLDREIRLPESLDRLRREYDWLAGLSETTGSRWEQAPSFFCRLALRGFARPEGGGVVVEWVLRDTVSGKSLARREQKLPADAELWPAQIEAFLPALLLANETKVAPQGEGSQAPESVSDLENVLRTSRGLDANVALIKLALADPASPLLRARGFEKGQSKRDGLDALMNFGFRDWLISRLPPDSPDRRWLQLARIYAFQENKPTGRFATGQRPDVMQELEKFAAQNPLDHAALAARYSVLYERQDEIPPGDLAGQCDALLTDLRAAGNFRHRDWLSDMTAALRDFARIAAGASEVAMPVDERTKLPHRIGVKWKPDGSPELEKDSDWTANEYTWVDLRPEEKIIEARAALAINGRFGERRKIQDRWLEEFPHSIVLASFAASAIHELNFWHGKPLVHALDWESERSAFLRAVDYVGDTLDFWLARAETPAKLDQLENTLWAFLMSLNERVYLGVYSDERYLALRDRLAKRVAETNARLGRGGWAWKQEKFLDWRKITPSLARELRKDRLAEIGQEIYDRAVLQVEVSRVENQALAGGKFDPLPWWKRLRGWDFDAAFTAPELAEFYLRHTPEILGRFSTTPPNPPEMGFLHEHALLLFYGGRSREAEELFRIVLNAPSGAETAAIQANAAFRLAQILRIDGRKSAAIEMAARGLEISDSTSWFVIGRLYDANMQREVRERGVTGGLSAHLLRLLVEMRFNPSRARLPDRVGVVSVATSNADNPDLTVFYRTPVETPGVPPKPRQALILMPSLNHDVLEYLAPENPWARFADAQGYVLICPRFYCTERSDRASHAFTYYLHPQAWSGKALLDALDKIATRTPLRKDRLLFHSYGSGAGYATRFARWRPDLVAAVSSHGGGATLPWFQEYPGLRPLSDLKNIRFFVTGGENDDFAENTQNRFACAEAMVTVLRGAGVPTEWKPFPGVGHFPTPEMEAASQKFLEKQ